jgi:hypothetical protein
MSHVLNFGIDNTIQAIENNDIEIFKKQIELAKPCDITSNLELIGIHIAKFGDVSNRFL